jgi:small-conductance mechanosensitive channel
MQLSDNLPQDAHVLQQIEHGWHTDLVTFLQHGLPKIAVTLIIGFVLLRLTTFFVNRMRRRADHLVGNTQRAGQLRTAAGIIRASAYSFIGVYVAMQFLGAVGVPLGPFIASAGVIGLGISFGAQSIFKDVLNGIFILLEDQFNVGDTVKLAGLQGTVEHLTLRCTTLRDGDGTIYIVPNSQIATVSNLSRDFSVATLTVSVDAAVNPDRVIAVLQTLATTFRADEAFKQVVIDTPNVLGVDKINGREVNYAVNVRVQANQRDGVLRELRRLVLQAFFQEKITLGTTTSTLILPHPDPTATPPQANLETRN